MKKSAKFENPKPKKNEKKSLHRIHHFVDFFRHFISLQHHRPDHSRPHHEFSFKLNDGVLIALRFFHCVWIYVHSCRHNARGFQRKEGHDVRFFTLQFRLSFDRCFTQLYVRDRIVIYDWLRNGHVASRGESTS